jgi:hypothetical protein
VDQWFVDLAKPGPEIKTKAEWENQKAIWMTFLKSKVFRNWPFDSAPISSNFITEKFGVFVLSDPRPFDGLDEKTVTQLRRRYMLVGQTVDSMRMYDMVQALKSLPGQRLRVRASGQMGINLLFASLFVDNIEEMHLDGIPLGLGMGAKAPFSDAQTADYLNVLRGIGFREIIALALERSNIEISETGVWASHKFDKKYSDEIADRLGWPHRVTEDLID